MSECVGVALRRGIPAAAMGGHIIWPPVGGVGGQGRCAPLESNAGCNIGLIIIKYLQPIGRA